jgi:hypothetical protein
MVHEGRAVLADKRIHQMASGAQSQALRLRAQTDGFFDM